jgi:hypothetical protein
MNAVILSELAWPILRKQLIVNPDVKPRGAQCFGHPFYGRAIDR